MDGTISLFDEVKMNSWLEKYTKWIVLTFVIGSVVLIVPACSCLSWGSPTRDLVIENDTTQVLTIYVNDFRVGDVQPGGQVSRDVSMDIDKYLIAAKSSTGEVVYSREYTYDEINRAKWVVTIPAL